MDLDIEVNDVVQLDPAHCDWGPVFVIVTAVESWGVQGYFLIPQERGQTPGCAFIRVRHADYTRIGRAEWIVSNEGT